MAKALTTYSVPYDGGEKALCPEVIDPRLADVEQLARWLDYQFVLPGGFRYGLGGFIGLIPGIGDLLDALLSLYIVMRAVQIGVPRVTLARMAVNVGIEAVIGSVPFLGALFDTVFKANRRNYQLLANHLAAPRHQTAKDWWFVVLVAILAIAGMVIPIVIVVQVFKHL